MIKKALIAAAALVALSAHAGYAQLAAPAGFGGSSGAWTYAASAANDKVFGSTIHSAGSLTANVGGQSVKMGAAYRLAANAPRIAAAAVFFHPGVRTAASIAAWIGLTAFVYDVATGKWKTVYASSAQASNGYEYFYVDKWYPVLEAACAAAFAAGSSGLSGKEYMGDTKCVDGSPAQVSWKLYNQYGYMRAGGSSLLRRPSSCPAGWYVTSAGCVQTPPMKDVNEDEFVRDLTAKPMPQNVPLELPYPTPLPIQQPSPWVNPSPGENPQSQPLRVPTGTPVPIPNTDPQQYRQPYVDIVPSPTPDNPWRVDVKPGETTSTNPKPAENPQPDSQDKPAEEEDKSLCEKHPEIAACEKVEVTDKPLPDQPKLYEPKYPDGITGVWNSKLQEIKATPLFNLAPSLLPNVSAGTCPSWKVDLSIDGWTNAGLQDVSPPCWVWDVAKLVIIASALLLARRLIFGG